MYQPKKTAKHCRNCRYRKKEEYGEYQRTGWCTKFRITISDNTNARLCKGFSNKHEKK